MFALLASALLGVIFLLPTLMASALGRFLSRPIGASPDATLYADTPATENPTDARRLPSRWQESEPEQPRPASAAAPRREPLQPGSAAGDRSN